MPGVLGRDPNEEGRERRGWRLKGLLSQSQSKDERPKVFPFQFNVLKSEVLGPPPLPPSLLPPPRCCSPVTMSVCGDRGGGRTWAKTTRPLRPPAPCRLVGCWTGRRADVKDVQAGGRARARARGRGWERAKQDGPALISLTKGNGAKQRRRHAHHIWARRVSHQGPCRRNRSGPFNNLYLPGPGRVLGT